MEEYIRLRKGNIINEVSVCLLISNTEAYAFSDAKNTRSI